MTGKVNIFVMYTYCKVNMNEEESLNLGFYTYNIITLCVSALAISYSLPIKVCIFVTLQLSRFLQMSSYGSYNNPS